MTIPMHFGIFLDNLQADGLLDRTWTRAERSSLRRLNLWVTDDGLWQIEGAHVERLAEVIGTSPRARRAREALPRLPVHFDDAVRQGFTSWGMGCTVPWHTVPAGFDKTTLDVLALRAVGLGFGLDLASPLLHPPHRPAGVTLRSGHTPRNWPGFTMGAA